MKRIATVRASGVKLLCQLQAANGINAMLLNALSSHTYSLSGEGKENFWQTVLATLYAKIHVSSFKAKMVKGRKIL